MIKPDALHHSRLLLRWISFDAKVSLSLEEDPAKLAYYPSLAKGPLPMAKLVHDFRSAWPGQSVLVINHAACEVATALLHHADVEVGDFDGNRFIPWEIPPWVAAEKIQTEIGGMNGFTEDDTRYILRRKNQ